jgi:hypothetical protein
MHIPQEYKLYKISEYEQFECYLVPGNKLGALINKLNDIRDEAYENKFYVSDTIEDIESNQSYLHLIIWDKKISNISCGMRIFMSDKKPLQVIQNTYLYQCYPEINHYIKDNYLEIGGAYINSNNEGNSQSLLFLFCNIFSIALIKRNHPIFIGAAAYDDIKNSSKVNQFFFECLKNKMFYKKLHLPPAANPYKVSQDLTDKEIEIARNVQSIDEIRLNIKKLYGENLYIPPLTDYYLSIMNVKISGFSVTKYNQTTQFLIHLDLRDMSDLELAKYVDEQVVKEFKHHWQKVKA